MRKRYWAVLGLLFGLFVSWSSINLQRDCVGFGYSLFCNLNGVIDKIAYFPLAYLFFNPYSFYSNEPYFIKLLIYMAPIFQWSVTFLIIGFFFERIVTRKNPVN